MSAAAPMPPPPPPSAFATDAVNGYDYDSHRFSQTLDGKVVESNGSSPPTAGGSLIDDLNAEAKKKISRMGPVPVSGDAWTTLGVDK
jgi:hypothetical protein